MPCVSYAGAVGVYLVEFELAEAGVAAGGTMRGRQF